MGDEVKMLEVNKIYCSDCLTLMKDISDKSIDLILADLPYGTTACSWDTIIPFEPLWGQYYRILRPNGFIVLMALQPFTTKLISSNINNFSHQWIWEKEQGGNPLLANIAPMKNFEEVIVFGNEIGKSKNSHIIFAELKNYLNSEKKKSKITTKQFNLLFSKYTHKKGCLDRSVIEHYWQNIQFAIPTKEIYENILQKTGFFQMPYSYIESFNPPRVFNPQKIKGRKYKSGGGYIKHLGQEVVGGKESEERYPTAIIKLNTDKTKSLHPTQKPVTLGQYLIKTYTNEGDLMLDNTCGSGSFCVAAKLLGRNYIGIDISEKYCEIARNRLRDTEESLFKAVSRCPANMTQPLDGRNNER